MIHEPSTAVDPNAFIALAGVQREHIPDRKIGYLSATAAAKMVNLTKDVVVGKFFYRDDLRFVPVATLKC